MGKTTTSPKMVSPGKAKAGELGACKLPNVCMTSERWGFMYLYRQASVLVFACVSTHPAVSKVYTRAARMVACSYTSLVRCSH